MIYTNSIQRRSITILICIAFLTSIMFAFAPAVKADATNMEITLTGGTKDVNGDYPISLVISDWENGKPTADYDGISTINICITYDSNYFEPKTVTADNFTMVAGNYFPTGTIETLIDLGMTASGDHLIKAYPDISLNPDNPGEIVILWQDNTMQDALIQSDGVIGTIYFTKKDGASPATGTYPVTFKAEPRNFTYIDLPATVLAGNVLYNDGAISYEAPIIPVSSIAVTGAGGATTIDTDDGTLQMEATVLPADASNKEVTWSVQNGTGEATISETGLLTAVRNGTVTAIATAQDGSGVIGSLEITISNQIILVESITVAGQGGATAITTDRGTLQMIATVLPNDATDKTVTWSVQNQTGKATINNNGLLTAAADGTVKVIATANDGSGVAGEAVITISNQALPPSAGLTDPFFVLSQGDGTVTPAKAQDTLEYETTVPYAVDSITVTPTAAAGTIEVNGVVVASGTASDPIALTVGDNTITIDVTEEDHATKTYIINVNREQPSTNADLSNLTVDTGTLTPAFGAATTTYTVELPFGTTTVPTVTATAADANAQVDIDDAANLTGTEAERTTKVTVTAQDETTKKEYKVIFSVAKQFTVATTKTEVGNRQHVTVDVNNAGSDTDAVIILALYENSGSGINEMKALIFKEATISAGDNDGILTGGFLVPAQYTIKAFVWDDFNAMTPLSNISKP